MVVSGTAGTGKLYLIHCLRLLFHDTVHVVAPTDVAAFNADGHTLQNLPTTETSKTSKENISQQALAGTSLAGNTS